MANYYIITEIYKKMTKYRVFDDEILIEECRKPTGMSFPKCACHSFRLPHLNCFKALATFVYTEG